MPYAETTSVPEDRSRAELEALLTKYGATQFGYAWDIVGEEKISQLVFRLAGHQVRVQLPLPTMGDPMITLSPAGKRRTEAQAQAAYAQENRRRWRSLVMVVKAKLVAVSDGITTLEREFLADVVLPDGQTVGQWVQPQLADGGQPALLPGGAR